MLDVECQFFFDGLVELAFAVQTHIRRARGVLTTPRKVRFTIDHEIVHPLHAAERRERRFRCFGLNPDSHNIIMSCFTQWMRALGHRGVMSRLKVARVAVRRGAAGGKGKMEERNSTPEV